MLLRSTTEDEKGQSPGAVKKLNPNDPDPSRSESGAEKRAERMLSAGGDQISISSQLPSWEGQGPLGPGLYTGNEPTPALR